MVELNHGLRELGRTVGDVSDRLADPHALGRVRRRLLSRKAAVRSLRGLRLAIVATVLVGAMFVASSGSPTPPVTFEVGTPPRAGAVGDLVAAESRSPLEVRFSEGTELVLEPGARMRVTDTSPRGANVVLDRGGMRAEIQSVKAEGAAWTFWAGPFAVRVTGTNFRASWDPASETFELTMIEGSVHVSGPSLEPGRAVAAGESLRVAVGQPRNPKTTPSASAKTPSDSPERPPLRNASPRWREHLRARDYNAAMQALDDGSFARLMGTAPAGELWMLSDGARLGGRPDRARDALLALRGQGARGQTAFMLGKIEADQLRSPTEAVRWFETYLREAPNGPLAEQALGRLLELQRRGDKAATRALAKRYLSRYPNGAYAPLARSMASP